MTRSTRSTARPKSPPNRVAKPSNPRRTSRAVPSTPSRVTRSRSGTADLPDHRPAGAELFNLPDPEALSRSARKARKRTATPSEEPEEPAEPQEPVHPSELDPIEEHAYSTHDLSLVEEDPLEDLQSPVKEEVQEYGFIAINDQSTYPDLAESYDEEAAEDSVGEDRTSRISVTSQSDDEASVQSKDDAAMDSPSRQFSEPDFDTREVGTEEPICLDSDSDNDAAKEDFFESERSPKATSVAQTEQVEIILDSSSSSEAPVDDNPPPATVNRGWEVPADAYEVVACDDAVANEGDEFMHDAGVSSDEEPSSDRVDGVYPYGGAVLHEDLNGIEIDADITAEHPTEIETVEATRAPPVRSPINFSPANASNQQSPPSEAPSSRASPTREMSPLSRLHYLEEQARKIAERRELQSGMARIKAVKAARAQAELAASRVSETHLETKTEETSVVQEQTVQVQSQLNSGTKETVQHIERSAIYRRVETTEAKVPQSPKPLFGSKSFVAPSSHDASDSYSDDDEDDEDARFMLFARSGAQKTALDFGRHQGLSASGASGVVPGSDFPSAQETAKAQKVRRESRRASRRASHQPVQNHQNEEATMAPAGQNGDATPRDGPQIPQTKDDAVADAEMVDRSHEPAEAKRATPRVNGHVRYERRPLDAITVPNITQVGKTFDAPHVRSPPHSTPGSSVNRRPIAFTARMKHRIREAYAAVQDETQRRAFGLLPPEDLEERSMRKKVEEDYHRMLDWERERERLRTRAFAKPTGKATTKRHLDNTEYPQMFGQSITNIGLGGAGTTGRTFALPDDLSDSSDSDQEASPSVGDKRKTNDVGSPEQPQSAKRMRTEESFVKKAALFAASGAPSLMPRALDESTPSHSPLKLPPPARYELSPAQPQFPSLQPEVPQVRFEPAAQYTSQTESPVAHQPTSSSQPLESATMRLQQKASQTYKPKHPSRLRECRAPSPLFIDDSTTLLFEVDYGGDSSMLDADEVPAANMSLVPQLDVVHEVDF
ncbi:hypothetical protein EJ06DRAFT_58389 [Trichodelitschia bisporula]|uniref:Uncharacterized protein n=1 Tax=Trichodelitschia bisporula TaxID=703511 RepID=A0A6G1HU97_9PEZI|nr:hypothetical protein EJ06DRAFT_58389 [Trichodelitschia bisporula]